MEIETLAVSTIQSMVALCPHLQPFISSNDKTPFTDGDIDVYSAPGRNKKDWLGRVSVQVKGRKASKNASQRPSFQIGRTDLLGFQLNGGVLYFVVLVDGKTGKCSPYYALLTPFTIEHMLAQKPKKQKSISVSLKSLPTAPNEIEIIVSLALRGKKQIPSLGFDSAQFENMQSITVFATSDLKLDAPILLTPGETDFALEMTTTSGSTVPLGGVIQITPSSYVEREVDFAIRAGGSTYERATVRKVAANSVEAILTDGLTLVMSNEAGLNKINMNVSLQSNFAARVKALDFLFGAADHGAVEINGHTFTQGVPPDRDELEQLSELREHLSFLHELRDLFSRLGVDGSHVELDDIDESQFRSLRILHSTLVQDEEIDNKNGEAARWHVAIGHWKLLVLVLPGKTPDRWRIVDPFHPDTTKQFRLMTDGTERESDPITIYDIIERDQLPTLLNLQLDSVTAAYEAIKESDRTTGLANLFVLDLISAADACAPRKEEFLRGAKALNEWVISEDGEQPIHLINQWQIDWRRRALTGIERDSIRELRRTMARDPDHPSGREIELACALLLGEADEVEYLAAQMPDEQRRRMETWPIWALREQASGVAD